MSRKEIINRIEESVNNDVRFFEEVIKQVQGAGIMAKELISLSAEELPAPSILTRWHISWDEATVEEARKIVALLTPIKEFEKVFTGPGWTWVGKWKDLDVLIKPAPPAEDCVPVEVTSSFKSWKCERR